MSWSLPQTNAARVSLRLTSPPKKTTLCCPLTPLCLCGAPVPYPLALLLDPWTWALSPAPAAERRTTAVHPIRPAPIPPSASSAPTAARAAAAPPLCLATSSRIVPLVPWQECPAPPRGRRFTASTVPKSTTVSGPWKCTSVHIRCPACAPRAERPSPDPGYWGDTFAHILVSKDVFPVLESRFLNETLECFWTRFFVSVLRRTSLFLPPLQSCVCGPLEPARSSPDPLRGEEVSVWNLLSYL